MEPPKDLKTDFYGREEYVGRDPYGHFHNPVNTPTVFNNPDDIQPVQQDSYGTTTNIENDWYATNNPYNMKPIISNNKPFYTLFISMKRRTYWYIWKIHSEEYSSYKDFKKS